jgi:hypothetical protein
MNIKWTAHLKDKQAKKRFEDLLTNHVNGDPVYKRLVELLKQMELDTVKNLASVESLNSNPNWAYKQAFNAGVLNTIKQVEDLFDVTKETK